MNDGGRDAVRREEGLATRSGKAEADRAVPNSAFCILHSAFPSPCRLLVDPPAAGAWNMAVDEVLLEWAERTGGCCWRFYQWEEPTLSLGYFQVYEDRWQHAASHKCPVVRRASGGGAILHDRELTYSCVWPQGHRLAAGRLLLYEAVHASLIELLAEKGITASLHGQAGSDKAEQPPFLCFQRRSPGDIVVAGAKVVGSAQRRLRGAVLQHGSVLLARSPAAPELDGLAELAGFALDAEQLCQDWGKRLENYLGLVWHWTPLSAEEYQQAVTLVETKYGSPPWTRNRGR